MITLERLKFFPVSFYSVVMGLLGLTIALQRTVEIFHVNNIIPLVLIVFSSLVFGCVSIAMLLRIFWHKTEVLKDFFHPIKITFFPTFSISLLLFSVAFLPINNAVSGVFWGIGSVVHLGFTFLVLSQWIKREHFKIEHLNPAWFIPVVGNLLISIAGVSFVHADLLWFFFSIGFVFWLVLMTIVMYRVFFHEPLVAKMLPTLFILIAPPSIAVVSYFKLTQHIDNFARVLYYFALFVAFLLVINLRMFISKKFYLSQWAFTFPLAAIAIASALMFHQLHLYPFVYLHLFFVLLDVVVVSFLLFRTAKAITLHEICHEE